MMFQSQESLFSSRLYVPLPACGIWDVSHHFLPFLTVYCFGSSPVKTGFQAGPCNPSSLLFHGHPHGLCHPRTHHHLQNTLWSPEQGHQHTLAFPASLPPGCNSPTEAPSWSLGISWSFQE